MKPLPDILSHSVMLLARPGNRTHDSKSMQTKGGLVSSAQLYGHKVTAHYLGQKLEMAKTSSHFRYWNHQGQGESVVPMLTAPPSACLCFTPCEWL